MKKQFGFSSIYKHFDAKKEDIIDLNEPEWAISAILSQIYNNCRYSEVFMSFNVSLTNINCKI